MNKYSHWQNVKSSGVPAERTIDFAAANTRVLRQFANSLSVSRLHFPTHRNRFQQLAKEPISGYDMGFIDGQKAPFRSMKEPISHSEMGSFARWPVFCSAGILCRPFQKRLFRRSQRGSRDFPFFYFENFICQKFLLPFLHKYTETRPKSLFSHSVTATWDTASRPAYDNRPPHHSPPYAHRWNGCFFIKPPIPSETLQPFCFIQRRSCTTGMRINRPVCVAATLWNTAGNTPRRARRNREPHCHNKHLRTGRNQKNREAKQKDR